MENSRLHIMADGAMKPVNHQIAEDMGISRVEAEAHATAPAINATETTTHHSEAANHTRNGVVPPAVTGARTSSRIAVHTRLPFQLLKPHEMPRSTHWPIQASR
jgi:hypothetical protein